MFENDKDTQRTLHHPEMRGRGVSENPVNRFEKIEYVPESSDSGGNGRLGTQYFRDDSRSIITRNDSPDVSFGASINIYRGCEHGCVYCYARPFHEYLGLSAGLDFESQIFVKPQAAQMLEAQLSAPGWQPQPLALCGVTDPYQPIEKKLKLTRDCLRVLGKFRNPVKIITKSELVTRDLDLLRELHRYQAVSVQITFTTLNSRLSRQMEPRAAQPHRRLAALRKLSAAGIPTGILLAPVIPGLNDHEIPDILNQVSLAGAGFASYIVVRLPHSVKILFENWLERTLPDQKSKILQRIRELRNGALYDSGYFTRMKGKGWRAVQIRDFFEISRRKAGLSGKGPALSTGWFRRPPDRQLSLF